MADRAPILILTSLIVALLQAPTAHAQSCPAESDEIDRKETKTKIILTCRCGDGFWLRNGSCVPRELALKQSDTELELIVRGTRGEALKQQGELERYALNNKKWSPTALNAFLLSTLSAARAKFTHAQRYLSVKLNEFNDQIVIGFANLLDARQRELQSSNYVNGLLDRSILAELARQNLDQLNQEALQEALQARFLAEHGYYEEAERRYQDAARLKAQDRLMLQELNNAILITSYLRKSRDAKVAPSHRDALNFLARERASAEQAWHLAFALSEAGQNEKSAQLYREAIAGLQITRPEIVPVVAQQLDIVMHGGSVSQPFPPLRTSIDRTTMRDLYRDSGYTRADAILDALDYGKGDWKRSVRFLETATQMDPANQQFAYALAKARELSALQKKKTGR
jgi:hypothetical protein